MKPKTILVVDDDDVHRQVIATALKQRGFEVLEAADGSGGVELARAHFPDLVISDLYMEKVDGLAALDILQQDPTTATIPFILITGKGTKELMRKGMALGADDYLEKPFSVEELFEAVFARLRKQENLRLEAERKLHELRMNLALALPHEFQTPLVGILANADFLRCELDSFSRSEIEELGGEIYESACRLQRLVENFLLYSSLEFMGPPAQQARADALLHPTRITELLNTLATNKAQSCGRSGNLVLELVDGAVAIPPQYFRKIFEELLDNAFKFSKRGSPVYLTVSDTGADLAIGIQDYGCGMTAQQIAAIGAYQQFNRKFYEQQGCGLGLILSKRLAELYGGSLSIKSTPGVGTTVTLTLPASRSNPEA